MKVTIHSDDWEDDFWVMEGHNSFGCDNYAFTEWDEKRFKQYQRLKDKFDNVRRDLRAEYGVIRYKESLF